MLRSEKQGTGKGLLGNSIGRVFGTHAVHLFRQGALTARFNSQLAFVFVPVRRRVNVQRRSGRGVDDEGAYH